MALAQNAAYQMSLTFWMHVLIQIVEDYTTRVLGWGFQFTDHILDIVSNGGTLTLTLSAPEGGTVIECSSVNHWTLVGDLPIVKMVHYQIVGLMVSAMDSRSSGSI